MVPAIHENGLTLPNLAGECPDYVKRYRECQRVNIAKKGYHPMKAILAHLSGEHLAMDLGGPLQNPVRKTPDSASRCLHFLFMLNAIKDKRATSVIEVLIRRFSDVRYPRVLESDNSKNTTTNFCENSPNKCASNIDTPPHIILAETV